MTLPVKVPVMPQSPRQYDPAQIDRLISTLTAIVKELNGLGLIQTATLLISAVPVTGYGLKIGSVYADLGRLRIVRDIDVFFATVPAFQPAVGIVTTN